MKTERFEYLDSVRGIACMVVVFVHVLCFIYPGIHIGRYSGESIDYSFFNTQIGHLFFNGKTAVGLFFILSGFVLSYNFLGNNEIKKIFESIIKRPIRLSGVILFTMLPRFSYLFTYDFWTNRLWDDYDLYLTFAWNIFSNLLSKTPPQDNIPLWTINTELWGSMIVFAVCLIFSYLNKYIRMILLFLLLIVFIKTYYSSFIIGMIIADLHKNWKNNFVANNRNIISIFILLTAVFWGKFITDMMEINKINSTFNAFSLFLFVMLNFKIQNMLKNKLLIFIGGISYSIYVLHWILLYRYSQNLYNHIHIIFKSCYMSFALSFLILSIAVILISYFVDKIIDKPCTKFSTWFAKGLLESIYKTRLFQNCRVQ